MKRAIVLGVLAAILAALPASQALAMSPGTQGQPSQSCQSFFTGPLTPSGFNTTGFNHATLMYAGAQQVNSKNPTSVSQYDVACFQAANRPTH